ncbi:MAG: dockerin type I repeat-containing protein, partial [Candidatus Lokiarchaeota archaeon]|nr:dockerin type I repeat-containing protein [Candidatus Lokiarchaeota archaeon]
SGFDATGIGPSSNLDFLTITWKAIKPGESMLAIDINVLKDESTADVGTPHGVNSNVIIKSVMGDVNNDGLIDSVDGLLTAQYYAGLDPEHFLYPERADVNADGFIDIVDALIIIQYVVGLIDTFPADL